MKRLLSLFLAVMMLSTVAFADTETLFAALEKEPESAEVHTELSMKLNKPFEFIDEIMAGDDYAEDIPIDIKMLAESTCSLSEAVDMSYVSSDDGKKLKAAMTSQITLPLAFNDSLKADIWAQIGIWIDMDMTDLENPVFKLIYKVPFSTKYLVLDYAEVMEAAELSADELAAQLSGFDGGEMQAELNAFLKQVVTENAVIREQSSNRDYLITIDDSGFKNIIKAVAEKTYELIDNALMVQGMVDREDYRYQLEQYLAVLDEFTVLGEGGLKIAVSLASRQIKLVNVTLHINCNMYDVVTAFGGDMSIFDREKWWLDIVFGIKSTYKNVGKAVKVDFPVLTEENSQNMLSPDYLDYESEYESIYISTHKPIEPDGDGYFAVLLQDTMAGCGISKKYYSVDGDKILITPREGQYDFSAAEMTVGSDKIVVDGKEIKLSAAVSKSADGEIFVPVDAVEKMTGYRLESASYSLADEEFAFNSVVLKRQNPDYVEEEYENDYVSPWAYVYGKGKPVVKNGEVYVPLKDAMLEFGVKEDEIKVDNSVITAESKDGNVPEFGKIQFREFGREVVVDDEKLVLKNPVIEQGGKAYFPAELLEKLGCTLQSVSYSFEDKSYDIGFYRKLVYDDNEWLKYHEFNYLSVDDAGGPVVKNGEYFLPLNPLMGELKVRAENIKESGSKISVTSENPVTGFSTLTIDGVNVTKDSEKYLLTGPVFKKDGKNYVPAQFVENVLGGSLGSVEIYYDENSRFCRYNIQVPNPIYEQPQQPQGMD